MSARSVFTNIYEHKKWHDGSGSGSTPGNTVVYREFLEEYVREHRVGKVLDLGCGTWSSTQFIDWGAAEYLGVDVVDSVVARNRTKFETNKIGFRVLDFANQELPEADLVIVKDVLQHWPNTMVAGFIGKLAVFDHALITNTVGSYLSEEEPRYGLCPPSSAELNADIDLGEMRPIDLSLAPFNVSVDERLRFLSRRATVDEIEVKSIVRLQTSEH